ncbi:MULTISPECIES: ribonuclease P protein component [Cystobacter]|uniref:Ribonuclease P protein component n=2 Tax=Cystobacter TaxID=42 RepID=A0A1L9B2W4_9BACT|nr:MULTISPECIES: ribonuclease P protein component [Cystobacter]EPX64072.1 Ribonuclease P protein component [Cystobacter fuscus DSM 2262]OJH36597.1 ribonuclease P protein component [Cystobacter ferrugineus]WNG21728.1 ribonuclease P protein component [Cystobacter fuscus]WNG31273.1 ribonuclease P protein component [Cystobacter fuscus]
MKAEGQAPSRDERFPKALRLLKRREFLEVQEKGQKVPVECLLGLVRPNGRPHCRVGLTISSKVGNAVERARLRRLLRECFRKRHGQWPPGVDVVLVVRQSAKDAPFPVVSRAFDGITRKLQRLFPSVPRESPPR